MTTREISLLSTGLQQITIPIISKTHENYQIKYVINTDRPRYTYPGLDKVKKISLYILHIGQVYICPETSLCHHLWTLCLRCLQAYRLWSPRYTRVTWHQGEQRDVLKYVSFSIENQIKREKFLAKRALQDMVEARPAKEKEVIEKKQILGNHLLTVCLFVRVRRKPDTNGFLWNQLLKNLVCMWKTVIIRFLSNLLKYKLFLHFFVQVWVCRLFVKMIR